MPELTYRRASQDDAEAIASVSAVVWRDEGESSGLREPLTTADGVAARLARYRDHGPLLLCDRDEAAYGLALPDLFGPGEGSARLGRRGALTGRLRARPASRSGAIRRARRPLGRYRYQDRASLKAQSTEDIRGSRKPGRRVSDQAVGPD